MVECYQCGCKNEIAVRVIWEESKAQIACLACQEIVEIPEEDQGRYHVLIEVAKYEAQQNQDMFITPYTEVISEEMLPF